MLEYVQNPSKTVTNEHHRRYEERDMKNVAYRVIDFVNAIASAANLDIKFRINDNLEPPTVKNVI